MMLGWRAKMRRDYNEEEGANSDAMSLLMLLPVSVFSIFFPFTGIAF